MSWHPWLRASVVDALRAADPTNPTLCEGWEARHLAAHLVLREHSPWRLGRLDELADPARERPPYDELVERVGAAPSPWSPYAWGGDLLNLTELLVHGEDVRRGTGTAEPVDLPAGLDVALRRQLGFLARASYRRAPVGVVLVDPAGRETVARKDRDGTGTVRLVGPTSELVLHAFGRRSAALVTVEGEPVGRAAFEDAFPATR